MPITSRRHSESFNTALSSSCRYTTDYANGLVDLIQFSRHTSGTTGLPRPIVWTHETCNQVLNAKTQNTPDGTRSVDGTLINGKRVIMTLPPFHVRMIALISYYYPSANMLY